MLQKMQNSVNVDSDLAEYMDFEKMWEKKHKSDGSKDLPKFGTSDFKFITVLGKGSFGKVCICVFVCRYALKELGNWQKITNRFVI